MSSTNAKLRLRLLSFLCALGAVCGCSKDAALSTPGGAKAALATMAAAAPTAQSVGDNDALAYEHTIGVETSKDLLQTRLREVEAACKADRASGCAILDVSFRSRQDLPSGSIRMRLSPAGVEPIIAIASKDGKVFERSTSAEDLAEPVADTERQLALMTLHRERLTELLKRKELDIDQVMALSKELATVQSRIDALGTQRANLRRRIDTDLLTINLSLPIAVHISEQSPVTDALRDFSKNFREAVAMVIRFLAALLPWLAIILPGLYLMRLSWRWIGRLLPRLG